MFDVINTQGGSISSSLAPYSSQSTPIGSGDTFSSMASQNVSGNECCDSHDSEKGGNNELVKMMGKLVEMISALLEKEGVIDSEDSSEDTNSCGDSGSNDNCSEPDNADTSGGLRGGGAHSGPGGGENQGMTDIFGQLLELLTAILEKEGVIDSDALSSEPETASNTTAETPLTSMFGA